ncbi:unnamed protein product [Microthlaspi erraticum]|uniref:SAWADEE domain-containing protein n=1 Tax=Microthlaspi erraticum TaxID=1685480 RepID=A0A6D2IJW8_9BRAS|nr:unnamed protein product [Microthlaspi erraticum]
MDATTNGSSPSFTEFTLAEIVDMEIMYKAYGDQSLNQDFCQTLACSFSCDVNRRGKSFITGKQVQSWFQWKTNQPNQAESMAKPSPPEILDLSKLSAARNAKNVGSSVQKQKGKTSDGKASDVQNQAESKSKPSPREIPDLSKLSLATNAQNAESSVQKQKGKASDGKASDVQNQAESKAKPSPPENLDLSKLNAARNAQNAGSSVQKQKGKPSYEAKSEKDGAWYDVDSFQSYRTLDTGEEEARVRFSGYGSQDDEWLNVEKSVRKRSVAVEPSECGKVKVGDLLVCWQEREDEAVYRDAHVEYIERRVHDHKDCSCVFIVRFDSDNTEEQMGIDKIWRRPDAE